MSSKHSVRNELLQLRRENPDTPISDLLEIIRLTNEPTTSEPANTEVPFTTLAPATEALSDGENEDEEEVAAFLSKPELHRDQALARSSTGQLLQAPPVPTLALSPTSTSSDEAEEGGGAKAKRTNQPRKVLEPEHRCCARIATGPHRADDKIVVTQCSLGRKDDSDFCTRHRNQATLGLGPLHFDEAGKKTGLFYGRVDQDRPEVDSRGRRCILYLDQELESFRANQWHPATKQYKDASRQLKKLTKQAAVEEAQRKRAAKKEELAEKKRGDKKDGNTARRPNAFFIFLSDNRAQFKEVLSTTSTTAMVRSADIAKVAGQAWDILGEAQRAHYAQRAAEDDSLEDHA
jgi:hypothetical protein